MENPMNMDDLGEPPFWEMSTCLEHKLQNSREITPQLTGILNDDSEANLAGRVEVREKNVTLIMPNPGKTRRI